MIKGYVDAYGGSENVVFVNSISELSPEVQAQINAKLAEQGKSLETFTGIDGFNIGDKTYLIGDTMSSPNDALRILKHERSHWGLNEVRETENARAFFDNIVNLYGGEAVVREALKKVGGNFYANENRYEVAEEFLSRIAEKVAGKHELDAKEKSIFEQAKSFMIDTFSYIPENASDEYIANQIRLIWDKNFGIENTGENFFEDNSAVRFRTELKNIEELRADYKEVISKYENTEQWMKAPNGKPTKLDREQWIRVRMKSFKDWFGDWENNPKEASKILDENGEPLVVYHGSGRQERFYEFKPMKSYRADFLDNREVLSPVFFFSPSYWAAKSFAANRADSGYGFVHSTFLSVKNPIDLTGKDAYKIAKKFKLVNKWGEVPYKRELWEIFDEKSNIEKLASEGYDGAIVSEAVSAKRSGLNDDSKAKKSFVAFEPTQIKSATGNRGDYNVENPDIRFKISSEEKQRAIDTAVEYHGITSNYKKAGYILPDGRLLDFSYGESRRVEDHRGIELPDNLEFNSGTDKLIYFMDAGAIRFSPETTAFNMTQAPTSQQEALIRSISNMEGGEVLLDLEDGERTVSLEYEEGTKATKILGDIKRFYNGENIDSGIRFRAVESLNDADVGKTFNEVRQKIPYSGANPPATITGTRNFETEAQNVANFLERYRRVKAADGLFVNLRSLERPRPVKGEQQSPTLLERAKHLIGKENIKGEIHRELDYAKLAWVYNIPETLHSAQAVFLNEWGSRKVRAYVKNYGGNLHIVLVNQKGETLGHLITQFPQKQNERHAHLRDARLSWFTPNASPNYSARQAHPSSFEQGRTSNLENRKSSSDEGAESQGKNKRSAFEILPEAKDPKGRKGEASAQFSVRSDSQKRATQLAAVFAPEIFRADGEITQAIRDEARRLAASLSDAELNAALEDARQIAAALSLEFDRKAASIPDKRVIDLTKEYMKSKSIQSARKTVEDAMRMASRGERLRQKLESDEEDTIRKMAQGVKGFTTDELALRRIDLADAVYTIVETEEGDVYTDTAKINAELQKIAEYVKKWADTNNADYEVYLSQLKRTLANAFEDIVDGLVYGKNIKSAMSAVYRILNSQSEKNVMAQSEKLAERLAEYFQRETKDFTEKDVKAKVKKSKEKAAKEEQRLEKARVRALKAVKNLANKQKLPEHNKLASTRKLPAKTQAFLAQIKKVINLSEEGVAARFEELKNRQKKLEDFDESLNYRERYEMSALVKFGALGSKSLAEILEAYDYIKKLIAGAENAQIERLEKLEAEFAEKAAPFASALSKEENKTNIKSNKFTSGLEGSSMLEHRLRNLFLARKGLSESNRQKIEAWITNTNRELSRASILERNWNEKESAWMRNTVRRVYADAFSDQFQNPIETQVVERLTKPDPKYRKYSVDGLDLSLGQVMQIVVSMEQGNVKQAYKQAKERMEKLQKSDKEIPHKFAEQFAVWDFRFKNEEAMRSELSAVDWELISALKRRYRERFDQINPVYEKYNGLPLISSGVNYMPLVRKGELDMESGGQSNSIYEFPDYYAPRTVSLKDVDEGANILALFQRRARTDAHFINFAGLIVELKTMFAEPDLANLVRTRLTPKERSELWSHLRDTLRGEIIRNTSSNDAIANTLSTLTAYMGLGFNLSSAFKQPTSFGAFALKVGFKQYVSNFIDLAASGQMLKVFNQIRKSEFLKDRRGEGINQIISELSREMNLVKDENSFKKGMRRFFVKYAFSPTKIADSWAFLGGASVYWQFYKNYSEVHDDATAQKLAMIDMVGVGEMTQQSAFVMNMSESQRKDGGFGRMFTLFRTTNQQYLSFEYNAFKEFVKNPNGKTGRRLARIMILNHIILPVLFNGAGLLANILLGDDMDEDDWDAFFANLGISMALDVFTGWWVTAILKGGAQAYFVGGKTDLASSVLPASALTRLASIAVSMGRDWEKNGFDADWQKQLDRMMKSLFAPYRLGKKVYDNATDDEKGVLW